MQEPANSPITSITRAATVTNAQGRQVNRVIGLDPRPANDALTSFASAPNDGFFTPANYRGAFAPGINWLCGWTASQAFGFTPAPVAGPGQPGVAGAALMDVNNAVNANGCGVGVVGDPRGPFFSRVASGSAMNITLNGQPNQPIIFMSAATLNPANFDLTTFGLPGAGLIDIGTVTPLAIDFIADGTQPGLLNSFFNTGATGTTTISLQANFPPGTTFHFQAVIFNTGTVLRATNAVEVVIV